MTPPTTSTKSTPTVTTPPRKTRRIFNFAAGPAVLPEEVLRQAQEDLWDVAGSGIGICEHSHRGPLFSRVLEEAEADCRRLAGIGEDHAVLFLQGGASLQFAMVPMCFLGEGRSADYLDTGVWTSKAIKEARLLGKVNLAYEGAPSGYDHVPSAREIRLSRDAAYTYYCSNNTIYGTQFPEPPSGIATPLVCDASSDIFSRPLDVAAHALVFAGAQKNLGPAGCTLVVISREMLGRVRQGLPSMLDYRKHAEEGSCYNTPPVFAIHVMGLVFKWIELQGGLAALARRNREKAQLLYDAIDRSGGFYRGVARPDSRSLMNVTFRTPSEDLDKKLVQEAAARDMDGLKGHRSAGGLRASIYNAFPRTGCEALAELMGDFARRHG